jgi:hypothetical protein
VPKAKRAARPIEWPSLPTISRAKVSAVSDWLSTSYGSARESTTAAPFLVLLYELEKLDKKLPTRARIAAHLNVSPYGIDTVLSREIGRGVIDRDVTTLVPGGGTLSVRPDHSIKERRLYICKPLREILQGCERKAA